MHKIRSYTPSFEASSGLYFVQDENNFINPLFQVGSGSKEKKDPDPAGQKSTDPARSLSLDFYPYCFYPAFIRI